MGGLRWTFLAFLGLFALVSITQADSNFRFQRNDAENFRSSRGLNPLTRRSIRGLNPLTRNASPEDFDEGGSSSEQIDGSPDSSEGIDERSIRKRSIRK